MRPSEWENIANCANRRVLEKSFNFDCEDSGLIGDLETREMAKQQAYRSALLLSVTINFIWALIANKHVKGEFETELKKYEYLLAPPP